MLRMGWVEQKGWQMARLPTRTTPEQKEAMLLHGTWHLFLARREQLYAANERKNREDREPKGVLFDRALKEFMPKPGQEPPAVRPKRSGLRNMHEALAEYDKAMEGVVLTDEGMELHAPGDIVDGEMPRMEDGAMPGDFDGGEMADAVAEVVDWDDEEVQRAKAKVDRLEGTKLEVAEQLKWVLDHVWDDKVKRQAQAPTRMAWTILKQCRESATFREKFILTILPKMLPKDLGEREEKDEDGFEGDEVVDALGEIMAMSEAVQSGGGRA